MNQRNPAISKGVDWSLVWIWFILCSLGVMSIFAASYHDGDNIVQGFISLKTEYSRQLLYFIMGGIAGTFILLTDSKFFTATANLGYAFGILLLLLVFPFHSRVKGTESIIRFGTAFQLQPADLCKDDSSTWRWRNTSRAWRRILPGPDPRLSPASSHWRRPCSVSCKKRQASPWSIFLFSWSCSVRVFLHRY